MDQNPQNIVRLESSRSNIGFALFIMVPLTVAVAAFSFFLFRLAAQGGPQLLYPLGFGLLCLGLTGAFVWVIVYATRKMREPDVLEFLPQVFHFLSVVDGKDLSAPWSEVGAPEKRVGGKSYYLHMDVAGKSQSFPDGYFNLSMETMMGIINSAREGHVISPAEWLLDHPEPDETKASLIAIGVGVAGAALIGAIIVLTAHH